MILKVKIPGWALGKPIYVIAGKELLAYQEAVIKHEDGQHVASYSSLKVKIERCNGCGQCCKDCVFVRSDGCPFGEQIPLKCVVSDCSNNFNKCTERFLDGLDSSK